MLIETETFVVSVTVESVVSVSIVGVSPSDGSNCFRESPLNFLLRRERSRVTLTKSISSPDLHWPLLFSRCGLFFTSVLSLLWMPFPKRPKNEQKNIMNIQSRAWPFSFLVCFSRLTKKKRQRLCVVYITTSKFSSNSEVILLLKKVPGVYWLKLVFHSK